MFNAYQPYVKSNVTQIFYNFFCQPYIKRITYNTQCNAIGSGREPERVFKIVLAGDAAVGKSSFIMRLCKDKFITNLNSTVG